MWVSGEDEGGAPVRRGLVSTILDASARLLEAEQDRWTLWVPVLFAAGVLTYFALADEPGLRLALALLIGALGFCLALRHAPLGLCIGGAALAFASGFAVAKLRTEMVRAPVLTQDLGYVTVAGFVEAHELRDKGRARIMLHALAVGDLNNRLHHKQGHTVRRGAGAAMGSGRVGEGRWLGTERRDRGAPVGGGQPRVPPATAANYSAE